MRVESLRKGLRGTMHRVSVLPVRYGFRPERLVARLLRMTALLDRWDTEPTIPITAIILERHPAIARRMAGADLAIHGYRHVPYPDLSPDEKLADFEAACSVFTNQGLVTRGFRAPYLQADRETLEILRRRGFLFDSSNSQFALPSSHPLAGVVTRLGISRYGLDSAVKVGLPPRSTPVELPVSLPDDEILVDGLGIHSPAGLWHVFEAMLEATASSGSHFVLQVHPERFHICESALELLLDKAADSGGWLTSLSQAAEWIVRSGGGMGRWPGGHSFALSVTGDLDAVSIGDFASRVWGS